MEINTLLISPVSITLEITSEKKSYFSSSFYYVFLDGYFKFKTNKNVFTIYDIEPNSAHKVKIIRDDESYIEDFKTLDVSEILTIDPRDDLNEIVNSLKKDSLLVLNPGIYNITQVFLKNNIYIYLKKGVRLVANTNRLDYQILPQIKDDKPYGNWEGELADAFSGIISAIDVENIMIVGQGVVDGNAQNSDWWVDPKKIRIAARPNTIYTAHSSNIYFEGIKIMNSPSWTIHPYYSDHIYFYNVDVENPSDSPNTDGLDPDSSSYIDIVGCHFSVGDDCIAIKSGKISMVEKYYKPSSNITIRNCLMENGHGGVVLGSELSSGLTNLSVSKCYFKNTDRGLRIKTRRGRGNKAIIDDVEFDHIFMEGVLNPFVINMYYNCDKDGHDEYVQSKDAKEVDYRTPYIGKVVFKNIKCKDVISSCAFMYGLPEKNIKSVTFKDVYMELKESDVYTKPAMMDDIEPVNGIGMYFSNVENIVLDNVTIKGLKGEKTILNNIKNIDIK